MMIKMTVNATFVLLLFVASSFSFSSDELPIEEFIRQTHIAGIAYNEAKIYSASETNKLFELLDDTNYEPYWANIIVTIAIIGDESDVERVIDFINEDVSGEFSEYSYRAKQSAIFSLGYMVNNIESQRALKFLETKLDPSSWNELEGVSRMYPEISDRNRNLSKYAVLGLALSGTSEAVDSLERFKRSGVIEAAAWPEASELADQAILESSKIKSAGMDRYQSHRHQTMRDN